MVDTKYYFNCDDKNLFQNDSKFQYIMSRIVHIPQLKACKTMIKEPYSARWCPSMAYKFFIQNSVLRVSQRKMFIEVSLFHEISNILKN